MEIFSLQLNASLCKLHVEPIPLPFTKGFFKFVEGLTAIAAKFNVNFLMPATLKLAPDEEETFMLLRAFALDEPLKLNTITGSFIKSPANAMLIPQQLTGEINLRMEHENSAAMLFDIPISIGPTVIHIERAEVVNLPETMKRFVRAKMGTAVPIPVRPLMPVRFELVRREDLISS